MTILDFTYNVTHYPKFTMTDTFAIIAHFLFLQISAFMLFVNNLHLGPGLTKLCGIVNDFNKKYQGSNPGVKNLMIFRYSVCIGCTVASTILFVGIRNLVVSPERVFNHLDFLLIFFIVVGVYIENQNHMFTEMLFLRFTDILDKRFDNFVDHLKQCHSRQSKGRPCCIGQVSR